MKISLFGKNLFEIKKNRAEAILGEIAASSGKSKYLEDFYKFKGSRSFSDAVILHPDDVDTFVQENKKKSKKVEPVPRITPKEAHTLKLLNDEEFSINTDEEYVNAQLEDFKQRLSMISSEEYDMRNGVNEIASIVMRLENRKKYAEFKKFFEQYPYTRTAKINQLTKKYTHLKMGQIAQFIAELPKEAVDAMKGYTEQTEALCGQKAVFYIIADKKDFKRTDERRDPILLAQSPFGHFWQILGAWDEEMLLVDEL